MVTIATNTFVTSMLPYPSQPQLAKGTQRLVKAVSIETSHMENSKGFSQAPLKRRFPTFHCKIFFLLSPHFFFIRILQSPSKT